MKSRLLPFALLLSGCPPAADGPDSGSPTTAAPFTLIVLPDTQYYTLGYPQILDEMLAWAAETVDEHETAFLLHEGDLTHENSEEEWSNARRSFDLIEGVLPYAVCVGNHDEIGDEEHAWFDRTFPLEAVFGEPWFGGTYRSDSLDSAWYRFEAGGASWLVLTLTYGPDDEELTWAEGVLAEHPDHRVLLLTHAYLGPDGSLTTPGIRIWNALQHHPHLSFTFNGHYTDGEAAYRAGVGEGGNTVHQLFFNVQDRVFGGQGLLRTLRFEPESGSVAVQTYSPWLDWHEEGEEHRFVLEGVDLDSPP
jgi:hypothetical protein